MTRKIVMAGLSATAFERVVQNNSTAQSLNSTTRAADGSFLRLSVETNSVRFRTDGTDPTGNTGVVLQVDTAYEFFGYDGTSALKFYRDSGGTSVINVERYKHPGEGIS